MTRRRARAVPSNCVPQGTNPCQIEPKRGAIRQSCDGLAERRQELHTPRVRRNSRIFLVLLNVLLSFHFLRSGQMLGWLFVVSGVLLVYGAFRYGSVHAGFRAVRNGRLDVARAALAETSPRYLDKRSQAYASWVRAALAEGDKDLDAALSHLEDARQPALSKNDRTVIRVMEAAIHERLGNKTAVERALRAARQLEPSAKAAEILRKAEKSMLSQSGS